MSVLVQASGAQVLPDVGDQRVTISGYHASLVFNADHRAKYPVYATVASGLFPRPDHTNGEPR